MAEQKSNKNYELIIRTPENESEYNNKRKSHNGIIIYRKKVKCENNIKIKNELKIMITDLQKNNKNKNIKNGVSIIGFIPIQKKSKSKKKNNETLGITTEKCIGDTYKISYPEHLKNRSTKSLELEICKCINRFKLEHSEINIIEHVGSENGKEDFKYIINGNMNNIYSLSVKTNDANGSKVAPQNIGQPGKKKFDELFKKYGLDVSNVEEEHKNKERKRWILNKKNCKKMLKDYFDKLLCCDALLYLKQNKNGEFSYSFYTKESLINKFPFTDSSKISFTRTLDSIETWKEGTTVKYNEKSIGEFQFHSNRDCIKFRFIFKNLMSLLN